MLKKIAIWKGRKQGLQNKERQLSYFIDKFLSTCLYPPNYQGHDLMTYGPDYIYIIAIVTLQDLQDLAYKTYNKLIKVKD